MTRFKRVFPFLFMCMSLSALAMVVLNAEVGSSNNNLTGQDQAFLRKAAMSGLAEVALGKLAVEKGLSPEVKILGKRMMADHEAINADLTELARKKGVELPVTLDERCQARIDLIRQVGDTDFDRAYLQSMAAMNEKDATEFEKAQIATTDDDLKRVLSRAIPVLQNYVDSLKDIQSIAKN